MIIPRPRFEEIIKKFNGVSPVIVAGDIGIDKYTYGEVKRISPEAPVPILEVQKEWRKLGLGANVSDNLKTLGIESTLCGVIGNDRNAEAFEEMVKRRNLKTRGLVRTTRRNTILKERVITNSQQICRIDYESNHKIDQTSSDELLKRVNKLLKDHQAVIIQDYNKGTFNQKLIENLIAACKEAGKMINIDPHYQTKPESYKNATLLKPNYPESRALAFALGLKEDKLENIGDILVDKLNLEKLVITLGSHGMALLDTKKDGVLHKIPTVATEVFDVSGAGDTVIGLLTISLLSGASLEEAAWIGNGGAGVVVRKKGTATVNLDELKNFHQKLLRNLTRSSTANAR
ncbi:MAG: PfkB family carbohydrate kinase [Halobacteriovoraceae bacterium]|nr:PfkB family carbohydrate kinase [Halobacteriovoraceae bacterium]